MSNEAFARIKIDKQLQAVGWDLEDGKSVHYEYPLQDKTKADYAKARKRDKKKIEWCELNDFTIIVLPYNKEEQWKNLIIDLL